jgi:hypothetical protein
MTTDELDDDDTTNEVTYLVIGQSSYGHAPTLEKAKANYTDEEGSLIDGYTIIEFPVGLCFRGVDGLGRVSWSGDTDNIKPVPTVVDAGMDS